MSAELSKWQPWISEESMAGWKGFVRNPYVSDEITHSWRLQNLVMNNQESENPPEDFTVMRTGQNRQISQVNQEVELKEFGTVIKILLALLFILISTSSLINIDSN